MRQGLCNGTVSVCTSVRPSVCPFRPLQQHAAGLLLWAPPDDVIDCCTAHLQQAWPAFDPYPDHSSSTAVSSKCERCYVYSDVGSYTETWYGRPPYQRYRDPSVCLSVCLLQPGL